MDAQILKPFFDKVQAHFKDVPVRMAVLLGTERHYRDRVIVMIDPATSCDLWVDDQLFYGRTLEAAFEQAKAQYKPRDKAREEAAEKLRAQADAIEKGEAPIPKTV